MKSVILYDASILLLEHVDLQLLWRLDSRFPSIDEKKIRKWITACKIDQSSNMKPVPLFQIFSGWQATN